MVWRSRKSLCLQIYTRSFSSASVLRHRTSGTTTFQNIASVLAIPPRDLNRYPDSKHPNIQVTGHVRTIRNQKHLSFVKIGDGSTTEGLQALLKPSQAKGLGTGTAVKITGEWLPSPEGYKQAYELQAQEVIIVGEADAETYPLQKKYHSAEYLRTIPHLRLRTPSNALLARLRSDCEFEISNYFRKSQFVRTHPPIITSSDCEGAGEVFMLRAQDEMSSMAAGSPSKPSEEYFRAPKYLTVSSQLHLEAYVHEHPRVWTLSPTFRAEKSDTPRHLSEFYMLEAEWRCTTLEEIMDVVENMVRQVTTNIEDSQTGRELINITHPVGRGQQDTADKRLELLRTRWRGLRRAYWPRITYTRAIEMLQAAVDDKEVEFSHLPNWNGGLLTEHERFIAAKVGLGSPVFVTHYPRHIKPFYMLPSNDGSDTLDEKATVACFDLIFPDVCEVVGGSLREHRFDALTESMQRHNVLPSAEETMANNSTGGLGWYLDLRKYGSVPHGGFGLGFDRLLGYLAGIENIRDVAAWPRYYGKCAG